MIASEAFESAHEPAFGCALVGVDLSEGNVRIGDRRGFARPSLGLGTPQSREISWCHDIVGAIVCIKTWLAPPRMAAKRICKSRQGAVVRPAPASSKQMRSAERLHCVLHAAEAALPLCRRSRRPHLSREYRQPLTRTETSLPLREQGDGLVQATRKNLHTILRSTVAVEGSEQVFKIR